MKPEELRIGNWTTYKGKYTQVELSHFKDESNNRRVIEHMRPLHLTEDSLGKLGFSGDYKTLIVSKYSEEKYTERQLSIEYDAKYEEVEICCCYDQPGFMDAIYHKLKNIKYVHQLQNLYYVLTGKELILQEETIDAKR